jgi:hypothetical protein
LTGGHGATFLLTNHDTVKEYDPAILIKNKYRIIFQLTLIRVVAKEAQKNKKITRELSGVNYWIPYKI